MSVTSSNKSYALAALLIHGSNQTVTEDKMKAIFNELNLEFSTKLAQKFTMTAEKYSDILTTPSGAVAAPTGGAAAGGAAPKAEEKKEESESDVELDF